MYELEPSRRITPALAVVLVLLAGAVGSAAYFVTRQVIGDPGTGGVANQPSTTATSPNTSPSPGRTTTSPPRTSSPGVTTPATTSSPADRGRTCPALTEAAVKDKGFAGGLKLLLYVDADGQNGAVGAEAWICQNTDGVLIYQGHVKRGPFDAACCTDTLLIVNGIRGQVVQDVDRYIAVNPKDPFNLNDPTRTTYYVSRTEFYYIELPSGNKTTLVITRALP